MIIIVVLVVCKTRLFIRNSSKVLETVAVSGKKRVSQVNNERYIENPSKLDIQISEPNQNITNIDSVLPNRSPHLYEHVGKYRK